MSEIEARTTNRKYGAVVALAQRWFDEVASKVKAARLGMSRDVGTRVVDKHRNKQVPICNKQIQDTALVITKKETLRNKKAVGP